MQSKGNCNMIHTGKGDKRLRLSVRFFPQKNKNNNNNNNKTSKREDKVLQTRSVYHNIQEIVIAETSKPGHTACATLTLELP